MLFKNFYIIKMGIGDWGLGIGDWGLGIGRNPQSPIPKKLTKKIVFTKKYIFILIKIIILNYDIY